MKVKKWMLVFRMDRIEELTMWVRGCVRLLALTLGFAEHLIMNVIDAMRVVNFLGFVISLRIANFLKVVTTSV